MPTNEDSKLKTIRLKSDLIDEIHELAKNDNRNWNNMAETLMKLGMKNYQGIGLNT